MREGRKGRIFKRCGRCSKAIQTGQRTCACGSKSGTWTFIVDLNAPGEPRRQLQKGGFATAQQAQAAVTKLQADKAEGTYMKPTRQTVGAYLTEWLAGKDRLRASTRTSYANAVKRLLPIIGGTALQMLTKSEVKAAYATLSKTLNGHGRMPAVKTVHIIHLCLHTALEDALDDGLVARNVADGAHKAPGDGESPEMAVWTAPQIRKFLALAEVEDALHHLFWTAAFTGMRRGEVLGLRWSDVNFDEGFLSVRQQVARKQTPEGSEWAIVPPKTSAGRRRIDLDPDTVALLRRTKAAQRERSLGVGIAYDRAADLVFARADGHFLDPDSVSGVFEKLAQRSGLPKIRLHDLRHSHATLLLMGGAPVHLVSQRLGHASPMVTLSTYAHVVPGGQAAAAATFAKAITGA